MSRALRKPPAAQEPLSALDARIGARLRDARLAVLQTQEDAGAALGEDRTTLVRWERGQRRVTVYDLLRLARLYGVPAHELINLDAPLPRPGMPTVVAPQEQARSLIMTLLDQRPDLLPQAIDLLTRLAEGSSASQRETPAEQAHMQAVITRLRELDLDRLAPLAALNTLAELQGLLERPH